MLAIVSGCGDNNQNNNQSSNDNSSDSVVKWNMTSTFATNLNTIGEGGVDFVNRIDLVSNGTIKINIFEPGALVPALEAFDAVSSGAVDAAWSTAGYWAGKISAVQFFSAVPFGPNATEFIAWYHEGGGKEIWEEIYARHNLRPIQCEIISPEASGWFKKEINSLEDLKGLKMRFFGLGAKVMEKVGVSTQLLAGGDALSDSQRAQIEATCTELVVKTIARAESRQPDALAKLQEKGVTLHRWSDEILEALEKAWYEVVEEESAKDEDFARVWTSLETFRENYKTWKNLGFVD